MEEAVEVVEEPKNSTLLIEHILCQVYQSKLQMFTLFFLFYLDVYTIFRPPYWKTEEVHQHGGFILGSTILRGTFGELSSLFIVYSITVS